MVLVYLRYSLYPCFAKSHGCVAKFLFKYTLLYRHTLIEQNLDYHLIIKVKLCLNKVIIADLKTVKTVIINISLLFSISDIERIIHTFDVSGEKNMEKPLMYHD